MAVGVGRTNPCLQHGFQSVWMEISILQPVGRKLVRFGAADPYGCSCAPPAFFWNWPGPSETHCARGAAAIRDRCGHKIPSTVWRRVLHGLLRPDGPVCPGGVSL